MDFGNPKKLRFFIDLRPIPGSEAFGGGGGGGGHIVTDFVACVMKPKYLLKKSDRYMYVFMYVCVPLYFQLNVTTWCLIGFHGNHSYINDVTCGAILDFKFSDFIQISFIVLQNDD